MCETNSLSPGGGAIQKGYYMPGDLIATGGLICQIIRQGMYEVTIAVAGAASTAVTG